MSLYRCSYFCVNKKTNITKIPEFYPMSRGIINKDYLGNLPFYWVVFEAETELEAIRNTIDELERILKLAEKDVLKENDSLDAKLQCNSVNKGSSFLSVVSDTTRIRKMLMEKYFLTNQKK